MSRPSAPPYEDVFGVYPKANPPNVNVGPVKKCNVYSSGRKILRNGTHPARKTVTP